MPRISILTPVYNPEPDHLAECLQSVSDQRFADWEHILVDDGSTAAHVAPILAAAAAADRRRKVITRPSNGGIVAASSDALAAATGEFVALLDHDDVLHRSALAELVGKFEIGNDGQPVDVVYSDNDFIRQDGRYVEPMYKPDYSPERLRSQNYILHFVMARRALVEQVGGFRDGYDGAQDHDLLLRLAEAARGVGHVPVILYHFRKAPESVATSVDNKPWAYDAAVRAIGDHCQRVGIDATVEKASPLGCFRLRRHLPEEPLVSVVIPTRGSSGRVWGVTRTFVVEAVRSMLEKSSYTNLEFVVVYDSSTPERVLQALERVAGDRLNPVEYTGTFNFSDKINRGAIHATGDHLLLLNDDTELIAPDSVEVMLGHLLADDVGQVGAKLLFDDGTVQHGGHVYNEHMLHACHSWPGDSPGPLGLRPLAVERECSGVTAAAAMVRRDAFEHVGGFCTELPVNFNDVDFSLKLGHEGYRNIWTPFASWYHFESRSRTREVADEEHQFVNLRWHYRLFHDPYYNPNLAPKRSDWAERPGRAGAPM